MLPKCMVWFHPKTRTHGDICTACIKQGNKKKPFSRVGTNVHLQRISGKQALGVHCPILSAGLGCGQEKGKRKHASKTEMKMGRGVAGCRNLTVLTLCASQLGKPQQ